MDGWCVGVCWFILAMKLPITRIATTFMKVHNVLFLEWIVSKSVNCILVLRE
jgi:hypothetical protein